MNIQDLKSNTTWQEASNTINNNNNKISLAIATLENARLKNKGYFTTEAKLKEAIPNPTIGSKAYVGTSEPYAIYIVENGTWVNSGYTGGDELVANITTDRIEDGAVTIDKIESSIQSLIANISKNATFAGIAIPSTNPGTPEGPVFYIATQAGTYANFNGIEVVEGEASILQWSNGTWSKKGTGFATQEKLTELESKVTQLDNTINGEKQILTFVRGESSTFCNFLQGHVYKCTFARYTPYSSEQPLNMKLTLSGDSVTRSYIPTENGVSLQFGESYFFYSPSNYSVAYSYTEGTAEWDILDITEQYDDAFRMMRDSEYAENGDAVYDSLGNIIQQSVLWSNGCSGILTKTSFNDNVFEYQIYEITCVKAVANKFTYKVRFVKTYDDYGNIVSNTITITKI